MISKSHTSILNSLVIVLILVAIMDNTAIGSGNDNNKVSSRKLGYAVGYKTGSALANNDVNLHMKLFKQGIHDAVNVIPAQDGLDATEMQNALKASWQYHNKQGHEKPDRGKFSYALGYKLGIGLDKTTLVFRTGMIAGVKDAINKNKPRYSKQQRQDFMEKYKSGHSES